MGDGYLRLYTRLWDEDEAMMREREQRLAPPPAAPAVGLDLGPEEALRASLPRRVELAGRRYQIAQVDDALVVYAAVCPHWLGPLADAAADGSVTCPWHGYRFDVRSGRRCDVESPLRLPAPPRLERRAGRVHLVPR
jgi:nitrite reductase/ring-hydroxylating ferredoxin subunit